MTMQNHLQFCQILLVLVSTVIVTQATIVQNKFKKLEPGESIMGTIGAELKTRSKILCSDRCLSADLCQGYQYKENKTGLGECILIHKDGEENFQNSGSVVTYIKVSSQQLCVSWNSPSSWTGPCAVLYQSFDNSDGFELMEGTQNASYPVPLVSGKVNNAWTVDRMRNQWVDLGIQTEVCMTRPETCGAAGGAISLWMKVFDCSPGDGIISSYQVSGSTGSRISCHSRGISFTVLLPGGWFFMTHDRPTRWTHILHNYIGPNDGQGIRIYYDGAEVRSDTTKSAYSYSTGDGRIVVGREYNNQNNRYASVEVDELIYFNASLTSDEAQSIYNSA